MIPDVERTYWLARHVTPHEPALRAWLRGQRTADLDVDDLVQETYALLAGLARVDHIESPRAYAFQTAQSLIRRHLRRRRIVQFEGLDEREAHIRAADDVPSPERHVAARQELWRVRDLIAVLPSRRREAFVLRRIEGLSQRDIAQRMGISKSVVEKHIGRALRYLMEATGRGAAHGERETGIPEQNGATRNEPGDRRCGGDLGRASGSRGAVA